MNPMCLCGDTGFIPVAYWKNIVANKMIMHEYVLTCCCDKGKDLWYTKERDDTDDRGKRIKIKSKVVISKRYWAEFNEPQFPWRPGMTHNGMPVGYIEFYMACTYASLRHYKKTKEPKIVVNWGYIDGGDPYGMGDAVESDNSGPWMAGTSI